MGILIEHDFMPGKISTGIARAIFIARNVKSGHMKIVTACRAPFDYEK